MYNAPCIQTKWIDTLTPRHPTYKALNQGMTKNYQTPPNLVSVRARLGQERQERKKPHQIWWLKRVPDDDEKRQQPPPRTITPPRQLQDGECCQSLLSKMNLQNTIPSEMPV